MVDIRKLKIGDAVVNKFGETAFFRGVVKRGNEGWRLCFDRAIHGWPDETSTNWFYRFDGAFFRDHYDQPAGDIVKILERDNGQLKQH